MERRDDSPAERAAAQAYDEALHRQPQEQAAARAAMQAEQRVDTWVKTHAPRIQQAWEHSTEGQKSWVTYVQKNAEEYPLVRQNWQKEVRTPAVERAVAQEAVREGIVPSVVAERYLDQSNRVFDYGDIGRREVPLRAFAGDIAYAQTLEQWKTPSRDVPSPEPAGRQDRDLARTAPRDQHERSQDMAARGWGQSWEEQRHAQERGLNP